MKSKLTLALSILLLLANSQISFAMSDEISGKRQPYVEIGGTRFFNAKSTNTAVSYDFFIPIWQTTDQLIFTDARIYDRSGRPFEGNLHLGYRQLSSDHQQMFGIYGAFDRKKTDFANYFGQITLGGEYWFQRFFIGGNFYRPIGRKIRSTGNEVKFNQEENMPGGVYKNVWLMANRSYEKAVPGADITLGYELFKGLTGYLGGYYFKAADVAAIYGPKVSLTYNLLANNEKKVLGIFDQISFGAGVQSDKPNGTLGYVSASFRIGLSPTKQPLLEGVAQHTLDLIRRDVDIVTESYSKEERLERKAIFIEQNSTMSSEQPSTTLVVYQPIEELISNKDTETSIVDPVEGKQSSGRSELKVTESIPEQKAAGSNSYVNRGTIDQRIKDACVFGGEAIGLAVGILVIPELTLANHDMGRGENAVLRFSMAMAGTKVGRGVGTVVGDIGGSAARIIRSALFTWQAVWNKF